MRYDVFIEPYVKLKLQTCHVCQTRRTHQTAKGSCTRNACQTIIDCYTIGNCQTSFMVVKPYISDRRSKLFKRCMLDNQCLLHQLRLIDNPGLSSKPHIADRQSKLTNARPAMYVRQATHITELRALDLIHLLQNNYSNTQSGILDPEPWTLRTLGPGSLDPWIL